jgi:glutathione peroxidase
VTTLADFSLPLLSGVSQNLADYAGKVVLVVNVASQCGLTPQYAGLEALYRQYQERGFVVLGFPCNQFAGQEPGSSEEIASFCEVNYGVTFPVFARIEVNGDDAHPLYSWLKSSAPRRAGGGTLCPDHRAGRHCRRHRKAALGTAVRPLSMCAPGARMPLCFVRQKL